MTTTIAHTIAWFGFSLAGTVLVIVLLAAVLGPRR